jgi:ubiquitin-conjugating enzyme E2 variant
MLHQVFFSALIFSNLNVILTFNLCSKSKFTVQKQIYLSSNNNILSSDNIEGIRLQNSYDSLKKSRGSEPVFAIPGDSTEETLSQKLTLISHFVVTTALLMKSLLALNVASATDVINISFTIIFSIILGDFATGVFHWSVDNYGNINTPIFGTVCAAFQGHHKTPWTITFRSFANNVYKICYPAIATLLTLFILPIAPLKILFFTIFINCWVISQEFHKYSHMISPPLFIQKLQESNIILSRKEHGRHHSTPFHTNYCILTGICNKTLDKIHFFRFLEALTYKLTGK